METHGKTSDERVTCDNSEGKKGCYNAHSSRRGWKMKCLQVMFEPVGQSSV